MCGGQAVAGASPASAPSLAGGGTEPSPEPSAGGAAKSRRPRRTPVQQIEALEDVAPVSAAGMIA